MISEAHRPLLLSEGRCICGTGSWASSINDESDGGEVDNRLPWWRRKLIPIFDVMGLERGHVGWTSCTTPRKMNQVPFDVIDHAYVTRNLTSRRYRERGAGGARNFEISSGAEVKLGSEIWLVVA